jgi:AcrR family transcriptional regulator
MSEVSSPKPGESVDLQIDTRDRILDAAEKLFAKQDYDGTSLREITEYAGANLAAVNYHFGSKKELYSAVLGRRFRPINQWRLEKLAAAEKQVKGEPVALRLLLDIFLRPIVTIKTTQGEGGPHPFVCLMNRHNAAPHPDMDEVLEREFSEVRKHFFMAMHRALPGIPPPILGWRMSLVIGGTLHAFASNKPLRTPEGTAIAPADVEAMFQDLLTLFEAAMRTTPAQTRTAANPVP